MAQGKRSAAQKIKAEESKYKALDLRKQGKSIRAIAATLKISIGATHKAINDALNEAIEENAKAGESLRLLELERLDALWEGVWPHAIKGNAAAVQACLRIMERRAKLLGLDAAEKTEVSGPGGAPITQRQFIEYNKDQLKEILGYREDDES